MLEELFPRIHHRHTSLPVLGPALEGFVTFLLERGYPQARLQHYMWSTRIVDERLREQGCHSLAEVTRAGLHDCAPPPGRSQEDINGSAIVHYWERYLEEQGLLVQPTSSGPVKLLLADYERHLSRVRGFAANTITFHLRTVSEFLYRFESDELREGLSRLTAHDIEVFIEHVGRRLSRPTLQHTVAHLRSLLRFLTVRGEVPAGLDTQIDTPRVYRGEKLPRALPWPTVCAFLQSIDRSASLGKRDYAIFQLMANYGLRSSEVVALRLDDIEWRVGRLQVRQRKTSSPLVLPLTDSVGESLADYLRGGRPDADYREVFLRHRAPAGLLKPTAVTEAFQAWSRRSGLPIPFQGAHCLRHSYAVHLLRQGASLKTIGDILGHRSAESTCVYLRLAVEDLREVALNLPSGEAGGVAS